jgi:hypothetical protein
MSSRLRMPALAFAGLSILLSVAVLGCAARTLHIFNTQPSTNVWLLPVWPDHFDLRGLEALIGTSVAILLLNLVVVVALLVPAVGILPSHVEYEWHGDSRADKYSFRHPS